ncbi:hypothetical protein B5M44_25250 [Shinella sumterensis]|uniref:hypothetical protein n=1 Tax=Shinella sumterensis TaxID=1967501 RepID=UPI00106DFCAF|nr:hypothetical protein [Shinella sumterensis]MCD1265464.1 hypothetical protein [Shinella sumterensis]TFE93284.1 hypothetical protein B5M44_25250 [Shinella sumterensis]
MTQYNVKIAFWLSAYDGFALEADSDAVAIEKAKVTATVAMEASDQPEHIEIDQRREGTIIYIDRVTADGTEPDIENVEFDDDRIHPAPAR